MQLRFPPQRYKKKAEKQHNRRNKIHKDFTKTGAGWAGHQATTILLTSTKWYQKIPTLKNPFSPGEYPPDSSLSAALLLLFRNEKKFPYQKMSRFRVPIPYLQNLAALFSMSYVAKFCRVKDFRLCSTTPPCFGLAIASPRPCGICKATCSSM